MEVKDRGFVWRNFNEGVHLSSGVVCCDLGRDTQSCSIKSSLICATARAPATDQVRNSQRLAVRGNKRHARCCSARAGRSNRCLFGQNAISTAIAGRRGGRRTLTLSGLTPSFRKWRLVFHHSRREGQALRVFNAAITAGTRVSPPPCPASPRICS